MVFFLSSAQGGDDSDHTSDLIIQISGRVRTTEQKLKSRLVGWLIE